jgi:putative transcriptional regulator
MSGRPTLDELLAAHAAGRLPRPLALIVATHLALSPASRRLYRRYEAVGGVLLDRIEPAGLAPGSWQRLCARLDETPPEPAPPPRPAAEAARRFPRPLRDVLPGFLEELRWRRFGGTAEAALDLGTPGFHAALLRVRSGRAVPRHTHEGNELTLVLEGSFRDELGRYARGDLAIADSSVEHQPVADEGGDCLCLVVTDARLRLTGRLGRLLNPLLPF